MSWNGAANKSRISNESRHEPDTLRPRQGILFVVSSPSGGGKTSLCRRLVAEMPQVVQSVSYTTRAPRAEERDGHDYHFISPDAFQARLDKGEFLEWARVHEHWYGTSRPQIETATSAGLDVLLAIDVQGAAQLRERRIEAVHIFILPPSWEILAARLEARGAEPAAVRARRLQVARQELQHYATYDYMVINDQLDTAVDTLKAIIMAERHRVAHVGMAPITHLLA